MSFSSSSNNSCEIERSNQETLSLTSSLSVFELINSDKDIDGEDWYNQLRNRLMLV